MNEKRLGKRINMARKDRGYTTDRLFELCNINTTYRRQIEGGTKVPSLSVFINIYNALKISPDYLLRISEGGYSDNGFWRNINYIYLRNTFRTALFNEMEAKFNPSFKKVKVSC